MHTIEKLTSPREPFARHTGRGVKVAIIDSGVNPAHPHVGGVAGGARISSSEADSSNDYLDYIGHGTAVAGAIRERKRRIRSFTPLRFSIVRSQPT